MEASPVRRAETASEIGIRRMGTLLPLAAEEAADRAVANMSHQLFRGCTESEVGHP